jgi:hypothetical protein
MSDSWLNFIIVEINLLVIDYRLFTLAAYVEM